MDGVIIFLGQHVFELILTGIGAVLTWLIKRYLTLEKMRAEAERKEFKENLLEEIAGEDSEIDERLDSAETQMAVMCTGLLSLQGKLYREFCEKLLEKNHEITIEEFEQEEEDYHAYKALGGNHRGDSLHQAVVQKFNKNT